MTSNSFEEAFYTEGGDGGETTLIVVPFVQTTGGNLVLVPNKLKHH